MTFTSSSTVRNFGARGDRGRMPERAGSPRSGRSRARPSARRASSRTSRPSATTLRVWSRRSWKTPARVGPVLVTFLSDYGYVDEFAGACRTVIACLAPEVRVIDLTHGIPRATSGAARWRSKRPCRARGSPFTWRWWTRGSVPSGEPSPCEPARAISWVPTTACWSGRHAAGRSRGGGGHLGHAASPGAGVGHVPRSRPVRPRRRAPGRRPAAGGIGRPARSRAADRARAAGAGRDGDALVAHVVYVDRFGNLVLDARADDIAAAPASPLSIGGRASVRGASWSHLRGTATAGSSSTMTRPAVWGSRSTAAARLSASASSPTTRSGWNPGELSRERATITGAPTPPTTGARELELAGAGSGTVVTADEQTAGRGRLRRELVSAARCSCCARRSCVCSRRATQCCCSRGRSRSARRPSLLAPVEAG